MPSHPHFLWTDLFRRRVSEKESVIQALRDNILFSTLGSRELKYLSTLVYERVYQPGEPIFQQNDRGFGMYIISRGRVAITTDSADGENLVTTLDRGSFFGELSLIEPENIRSASAVALERSVLIGFFKPDLMEILERKPSLGVKILFQLSLVLGKRLMETTERLTAISQEHEVAHSHEEVL